MALKFLNKKGWHTGSLRNIENVWKAEQKHDAEQKKLEELKKQIQDERQKAEYRLLQQQAGLVPKQERLDFLYDSGLSSGKGSTSGGFKELESLTKPSDVQASALASTSEASATEQQPSGLGALFEEKPQSANDSWRKLHSDPLLLIRKREQEALAHVKNNPVQMAMIRKSVEAAKHKDDKQDRKKHKKEHRHKKSKHSSKHHLDSDTSRYESGSKGPKSLNSEETQKSNEDDPRSHRTFKDAKHKEDQPLSKSNKEETSTRTKRDHEDLQRADRRSNLKADADYYKKDTEDRSNNASKYHRESSDATARNETNNKRRKPVKLSEEERAARLREMQMDAELHEEQRWKRLKTAEESDAREATEARNSKGKNFLDAAQRSIYGTEKGGSSTIEESVRRRSYYSQNRTEATERNAFRR
ncbi:hypothetical protein LIER_03395 [Lithospermum erythrorhizon]|uniref:CBF1-interacting co-repressor CIR N-terminal domain-containing protein n=1 Tax=Lithospermum erythrorhizon TaxID=34254 RepID=A0AAV3NXR8_LITER